MLRIRVLLSLLLVALVACAAADARERKKRKDEDEQKTAEEDAGAKTENTGRRGRKDKDGKDDDAKAGKDEKDGGKEEPAGKSVQLDEPNEEPKESKKDPPKEKVKPVKKPKASGGGLSASLPEDWEPVDNGGEMELRNRKGEAHVIARLLPSKGAGSPREWLHDYLSQVNKKKRGGRVLGEIEAKRSGDRRFVYATLADGDGDDKVRQRIYVTESGTPGQYLVLVASAPPSRMSAARKDFDEILDALEER